MSDKAKAAVPRFASFKAAQKRPAIPDSLHHAPPQPKRRKSESPSPPLPPPDASSDIGRQDRRHHHSHHHYHDSKHGQQNAGRATLVEVQPSSQSTPQRSSRPYSAAQPHVNNDLFTVDTKGDAQNWTYQRLHKYSIPQYRRTGFGHVLGLASRLKIDNATSLEDKLYLLDTSVQPNPNRERALLKKPKRQQLSDLRLSASSRSVAFDPAADFVPLPSAQHRTRHSTLDPAPGVLDQVRALQDAASEKDVPADPDLVYAESDVEVDADALDVEARQRNVELSRNTKADPTNLQAWLDLISHQFNLLRPVTVAAAAPDLTDTERRTLADIRLHIYDKAAKSIPTEDTLSRQKLLQSMFQEAVIVWDTQKYLERLRGAIREIPSSFALWKLYLDASQTDTTAFRFEHGKSFFLESLRNMHDVYSSANKAATAEAEDMYLYIVLRYTTFLRQAGYEELSISIWQALFEFHLFRPALPDADTHATLDSFESFWESETARFGESNASGWRRHDSTDSAPSESVPDITDVVLQPSHPFRSFVDAERTTSNLMGFPGRTADDTVSDDPFHIVFFSDIKEILEPTPFLLPYRPLTNAFLCFVGLPLLPTAALLDEHRVRAQSWKLDSFVSDGLLSGLYSSRHETTSVKPHYQHPPYSPRDLFTDLFPSRSMFQHKTVQPGASASLEAILSWVRRSLESLVREYPRDEALAEYYLAYECSYYPGNASKTAKAVLKKRPTSLRLYNACAMIEANLGRPDKAAHIWAGAIKNKHTFHPDSQQDAVLLWQHWTWSNLQQGEMKRALSHLVSFDGELIHQSDLASHSSSATLRVKKSLRDGLSHAMSHRNAQLISSNVECLALLAYLTQPDDLVTPIRIIDEHCVMVQDMAAQRPWDITLELLHQSKANIISHHIQSQRPYMPALVRSDLEASIKLFPDNTTFLWLYKDNETRFRVDDRVRSILRDNETADRRSLLVRFSFEIDQEMSRFHSRVSGSTVESVRATFSRALLGTGSQVKHSHTLWLRWLRFEEEVVQRFMTQDPSRSNRSTQQAIRKWKEVFLGGLHHLPWIKDWVLCGLKAFDSDESYRWSLRELKRLYNVLHERELRVRVEGLEDLLDDIEDGLHPPSRA